MKFGKSAKVVIFLLLFTNFVQAGYNGAESIDVKLKATIGDSAIVSVVYTPYAPGMRPDTCGCPLFPTGICCFNYIFYINESGAYFIDSSWDAPRIYGYNGYLYVFITAPNDTVEIFKMGTNCFEKILSVAPEIKDYIVDFAVSMPYAAFRVSSSKVVIYVLEPEVKKVKAVDLTKTDSFSFEGIETEKLGDRIILRGSDQTVIPSQLPAKVENGVLTFTFKKKTVKIPADELSKHLWVKEEINMLKVYPLENSILILPPDVFHYFSPCGNDTTDLLKIGNIEVKIVSLSRPLAVFFYKGRVKVFSLGTPTGTLFQVSAEKVRFKRCEEKSEIKHKTILLPITIAVILLAYMLFSRKR
ncbi:hypothetical protein E3E31_07255 [Thermococcus sp. M39]|uniref:hypothetical protein n=1 Tax=Thermococcus sp. M39 TaxID=1638262 RepID=UPI001439B714|nr:hypothetical protein [Thermococcus sp. M39]NJE08320.1 hypothetical protein [Thermococcus sp. M39]